MFKRDVKPLSDLLQTFLRNEGLEIPLKQKRLLAAWDTVAGRVVARYTGEKFIKNQTLFVKMLNPALRQDLSMMRQRLVQQLNEAVGGYIISDIHFY
ncbi:MAG: DUF721 domain-containing protein [Prevotella sp.]|jgi:hypothetical protein|nr:DUF721 domain-containing protein [Prevotella sp.]MBF1572449.1 DUF721 domain-containing protein [Prevotella sp.]MBF1584583.1 DUF721 domain-containing protein [Prevotella sp.]MBF1586844.1 DUF721 domain-containing protein [Prevotella sp.]